nr:MAG TPA: minor tail protein [Bacteriophage sp.]
MATNSDGSIVLDVRINKTGLNNELKQLKNNISGGTKGVKSFGNAISTVTGSLGKFATAVGVAFSLAQIVKFSNEASKLAGQTEANMLRVGQIYGKASQQVQDFVESNANALGMSKTVAYEAAANYGNLFSSFADGAENAKLTNEMLQTTAVIASKTGRSFDEVFTKIQSGIFGNTRAIDDLGIYVNQATLQYTEAFQKVAQGRKWKDLTGEQQKEVLSLAILEQAYKKYGNTVLQSTALTRSQYNAAFEDFKATWGAVINLVLMPVLRVLTVVFNYATMALKAVLKFFGKEVTVTSGAMNDVGVGSSGIADNIDNATKSQKKLNKEVKKTIAGFDDLQILSDNTSNAETGGGSGSGKGGGVSGDNANVPVPTGDVGVTDAISNFDISPFENLKKILEEISRIFMSGFWNGFQNADFTPIDNAIKGIGDNLKKIFTSPEVTKSAQNFATSFTYSLGQIAGSVGSIAITTGTNFYGGLNQYLTQNLPFIQQSIAKIFDAGAYISETVGNLWAAFANIFSVFASQNGITLTSNIVGIFANAVLGITTLATQIGTDFMNFLSQPIIDNQEGLKVVLDGLLGNFSSLTGSLKELVDGLVENILLLYDEHVQPFIETLTETVSTWVGNFVDAYNEHIKPVIDEFAQQFQNLVEEHLKPMFDKIGYFMGNMLDSLSNLWDTVLKPLGSWIIDIFAMTFSRAFTQVKDAVFIAVGFVSDIIGSVFQILGGLIDFVTGAFSGDWDKAWNGLVNVFKGILNGLISAFETAINAIVWALNGLIGGLNNLVNTAGDIIGQNWNIPSVPEAHLPRLARGAVLPANKPFLAVVGDQKRGTNIEAPAELIKQMAKEAIQEMNVTQNANQVIKEEHYYLNQTELMNIIYKLAKGGERIKGSNLVQQGGI